ncbi:cell death activator CIDE-3-like [Sceloporus undulatus]|uniref:cell death activator CIDE-3-like n=1 Tax=Sceloporus undulatus TaxID=8520 RepID=UPI001C4D183F|nr:cell death activator CIDE-3-like [Sceloporus undulatus]
MDYAKKSLGLLSPRSLSKCVSASALMTHQLLVSPPPPPPFRPFRVTNCDRTLRKGIVAESLEDLQEKVRGAFLLVGNVQLALDEDGTIVETEAFFRTLDDGTVFVVLAAGQAWRPVKVDGYQILASRKPRRRIDVACVTFDLYKTDPRDFVGCLNVKATLYGAYSMSYNVRCYSAKRIARSAAILSPF